MDVSEVFLLVSNLTDRLIFNTLGLLLSIYAYYVEEKYEKDSNYKPICDIDPDRISCTKVLTSP